VDDFDFKKRRWKISRYCPFRESFPLKKFHIYFFLNGTEEGKGKYYRRYLTILGMCGNLMKLRLMRKNL
jgi:hypothetical protein